MYNPKKKENITMGVTFPSSWSPYRGSYRNSILSSSNSCTNNCQKSPYWYPSSDFLTTLLYSELRYKKSFGLP